MIYLSIVSTEL